MDIWNKTIRKRRRQAGKEYVSSRGKCMPEKTSKFSKDCICKCRYKCAWSFNNDRVQNIHAEYWSLNDDQKLIFYAQTTERTQKGTKSRKMSSDKKSRRKYTYLYYFRKDGEKIRVCKDFYFGVLGIHDSRARNYYNKLDKGDGKEYRDMRGRKTALRTPQSDIDFVINHIASFNRIPSHYCRSESKKEYLECNLNLKKMYDMYTELCENQALTPVKLSMYRHVFNSKFNISFHVPRKDRCDMCEKMKVSNENDIVDEEIKKKYEKHASDKIETKTERDYDRHLNDDSSATICFDLENVINLPKAEVKNFFYKRKLNVYNLTAHCSIDKAVYNAIWSEEKAGRGSNEIASALICILREIKTEQPDIKHYILWSDSCVPQNRNSIMTYALKTFMEENNIDSITQKFACPGHSAIQEVDNAHSSIEKVLKVTEVYSPVSLVRVLKIVRRRTPLKVIQMRSSHFYDFHKVTNTLKFGTVPYTKVKCLKYTKGNQMEIGYKLSFQEAEFKSGTIVVNVNTRKSSTLVYTSLPLPEHISLNKKPVVSLEKRKTLQA